MAFRLFVPSFCGDVRLESVDDGKAVEVIIHDPTAAETEAVEKLLKIGRERKWTDLVAIPKPAGKFKRWRKSTLRLEGSIQDVGDEFVKLVRPAKSSIVALKFSNGEIHVTETAGTQKLVTVAVESKDAGARAVSVKKPTMSCPQCLPGSVAPANEVLQEFLTPSQHKDWAKHRVIEVEGGTTGHRYLVAHRNSRHAVAWGRHVMDADDRAVLHFHDLTHPPEEEVLGAKLMIEHRESWVRNEASCFKGGFTQVLKNPFGDIRDGMGDAAVMQAVGAGLAVFAIQNGIEFPGKDAMRREVANAVVNDVVYLTTGYISGAGIPGVAAP